MLSRSFLVQVFSVELVAADSGFPASLVSSYVDAIVSQIWTFILAQSGTSQCTGQGARLSGTGQMFSHSVS